jgi:FkbM family methyltransferase
MKTVHALGRDWLWPVEDTHMPADKFAELYHEAAVIFRPACRDLRVAIQAGGHVGVWPYLMAEWFERVYTFEPDARSYHCLEQNKHRRILAQRAALMSFAGTVGTEMVEADNRGAVRVMPGVEVDCVTIDSLHLDPDLIYLDIEGSERQAILGAKETIARARPVIGLEVKFGDEAVRLLRSWGYREIGRTHNDVIMQC